MTEPEIDYRCYLVTSGRDRRTVEVAAAAARAGAGVVQVRAKDCPDAELVQLASAVAWAVTHANPATRIVVDDRCDVVRAAQLEGAPVHGVHLGQDDIDPGIARAILGERAIIGWTTGTAELVERANTRAQVLSDVGCGPFRPTPTKDSGREPLGLQGYIDLAGRSTLPLLAIGDVQPSDVADLARTGVAGVCMVRAVMAAEDPAAVVGRVLHEWERGSAMPRLERDAVAPETTR